MTFKSFECSKLCWCGNPHEIRCLVDDEANNTITFYVKCECERYVDFDIPVWRYSYEKMG